MSEKLFLIKNLYIPSIASCAISPGRMGQKTKEEHNKRCSDCPWANLGRERGGRESSRTLARYHVEQLRIRVVDEEEPKDMTGVGGMKGGGKGPMTRFADGI
jgi:hypothetical protein